MKLIMDNGNEYDLQEIREHEFIYYTVKPNEDFINAPAIENITDGQPQPFRYKSIRINGKLYAPKL